MACTSGTSRWAVCESEPRGREAARLRLGEAWRGESRAEDTREGGAGLRSCRDLGLARGARAADRPLTRGA